MRILFLTHYFPPEVNAPASRTFEHSREWVKAGHVVTVVTCVPNHPGGTPYPGYRRRLWQREDQDGVRVIRLWTYLTANEGFAKRTLSFVSYMLAALLAAPFLPRADIVVSTSPQFFCGLAGYFVSRIKGVPWILEIRDLWPESIVAVGATRSRGLIHLLEKIEGWAYRKADRVVALTDAFRRHIEARGAAPGKVRVIKNGVDLARFASPARDPRLLQELGLTGRFVAAYFGTHGMAHHLETVLEAASLLRHDSRVAFLMVGDGAERARLVRLHAQMGLDNVVMLEQQPRERMPALWGACDVSLILLRKSPLFETVIPSKMFEAMAMERPIVLGVGGESRQIVEAAGCGRAIEPENATQLAAAVRFFADYPERARVMGRRGRQVVVESYDRARLAQVFSDVMRELIDPPERESGPVLEARG